MSRARENEQMKTTERECRDGDGEGEEKRGERDREREEDSVLPNVPVMRILSKESWGGGGGCL